jgi:hypothetical protein
VSEMVKRVARAICAERERWEMLPNMVRGVFEAERHLDGGRFEFHDIGAERGEAAMLEGFDAILIERDPQSVADIKHRIDRWSGLDGPLFADASADLTPD